MKDLASLLDAARAGLSPSTEEVSRGRARLLAAVAVPAVIVAATKPAAAGGALAVKLTVVAGGIAGVVVGGVLSFGGAPQELRPEPEPQPAPVVAPRPTITPLPEPEPEPVPEPRPEAEPEPRPEPKRRAPRVEAAVPPPEEPDDSLAREVGHLSAARAALREGDAEKALAALAAYRAEFDDDGQLADEAAKLMQEAFDAP
jgi:outer membrane biosynthesis protein TonB